MKSIVLTILYIVLALCAMAQRPMNENQKKGEDKRRVAQKKLLRSKYLNGKLDKARGKDYYQKQQYSYENYMIRNVEMK